MATRNDGKLGFGRSDDFHLCLTIKIDDRLVKQSKTLTTTAVSSVEPTSTTHVEGWEDEDIAWSLSSK